MAGRGLLLAEARFSSKMGLFWRGLCKGIAHSCCLAYAFQNAGRLILSGNLFLLYGQTFMPPPVLLHWYDIVTKKVRIFSVTFSLKPRKGEQAEIVA